MSPYLYLLDFVPIHTQSFAGLAIIQIPEMALFWFCQVKKRLWNQRLPESKSIIEIEPSKTDGCKVANKETQILRDTGTPLKLRSQPANVKRTRKNDTTRTSNERLNIMSARIDDIESKLQRLNFMNDEIAKQY